MKDRKIPKMHASIFCSKQEARPKIGAVAIDMRLTPSFTCFAWCILDEKEKSTNHVIFLGLFRSVKTAARAIQFTYDAHQRGRASV